jgi:hypothetical protein
LIGKQIVYQLTLADYRVIIQFKIEHLRVFDVLIEAEVNGGCSNGGFVDGGHRQQRQQFDGGMITQLNLQQWCLRPMVAAVIMAVVVNCAGQLIPPLPSCHWP